MAELQARAAAEITTTFASGYADTISLDDMLDPAVAMAYSAQATGENASSPREIGRDLKRSRLSVRSRGGPDDETIPRRAWMALFVSTLVVFLAVRQHLIRQCRLPVDP